MSLSSAALCVAMTHALLGLGDPLTTAPTTCPYVPASLKDKSDQEIAAYMGKGLTESDYRQSLIIPTRLPEGFWTLPPEQAALAYAQANRSESHKTEYRLAFREGDRPAPPKRGVLFYSHQSGRCYFTADSKYLLRIDPAGSYLARSTVSGMGAVYYDVADARPGYDLRAAAVSYSDASHVAGVIWHLRQLQSDRNDQDGRHLMSLSSADGSGGLRIIGEDGKEMQADGTVWEQAVSERWHGDFDDSTFMNLADYLLAEVLPQRLGAAWSDQAPKTRDIPPMFRGVDVPPEMLDESEPLTYEQRQLRLRQETAVAVGRLLGLLADGPPAIGIALWTDVVNAAGDYGVGESAGRLQSLSEELEPGLLPDAAREELRRAADLALRKVQSFDDGAALKRWAQSQEKGWQWALKRLREVDATLYADALEHWIGRTDGKPARQMFDALREADPARAEALIRTLPADQKGDLTVVAYTVLEEANAIDNPDQRTDALIQVALDPKSGWWERKQAIDHLVPDDEPLRYPDRKIDLALVRLFEPALADDLVNSTLREACAALARRGRVEFFDQIAALLDEQENGSTHNEILASLVRLAQSGGPEYTQKLRTILAPQLKNTRWMLSEIILFVYALDLRDLKPDIQAIATAGPEEFEWDRARSYSSMESPVTYRCHMARKVAAIWDEGDPVTAGKLMIALGFEESGNAGGVAVPAVQAQLKRLVESLSPQARTELVRFADWYQQEILKLKANADGSPPTDLGQFVARTFAGTAAQPAEQPESRKAE